MAGSKEDITDAGDTAKNNEKCELANGQRSEKFWFLSH